MRGFGTFVRAFLHAGDSVEWLGSFSGVATSRDSNGYTLYNSLMGALPYKLSHWVIRSFPLYGVKVLHPAQMI